MSTGSPIDEMFRQAPLMSFSAYSHGQVQTLGRLSEEIVGLLDESIEGQNIDGAGFQRIYGLFWLWVLGSYEVTRTMSEYKTCFSNRLNTEVALFKERVSVLRMPFAKLQFQGRDRRPINGEASIYGVDLQNKDLSFNVEGKVESVRALLAEFAFLTQRIEPADVLHDQRDSPRGS
jgi:hypothetical protein